MSKDLKINPKENLRHFSKIFAFAPIPKLVNILNIHS